MRVSLPETLSLEVYFYETQLILRYYFQRCCKGWLSRAPRPAPPLFPGFANDTAPTELSAGDLRVSALAWGRKRDRVSEALGLRALPPTLGADGEPAHTHSRRKNTGGGERTSTPSPRQPAERPPPYARCPSGPAGDSEWEPSRLSPPPVRRP